MEEAVRLHDKQCDGLEAQKHLHEPAVVAGFHDFTFRSLQIEDFTAAHFQRLPSSTLLSPEPQEGASIVTMRLPASSQ